LWLILIIFILGMSKSVTSPDEICQVDILYNFFPSLLMTLHKKLECL
jgi:hypothetical protein